MGLELRPATEPEMDRFDENLRHAFSEAPRPPEHHHRIPLHPEWTLCAFADGDMAATYAAWPFTMYLNGHHAQVAGVTAVSTLPWYRRRGYIRRIIETSFRRMHEDDGPALAILYASMAAIYHRFDFSVVSTQVNYSVEPRFIEFATQDAVLGCLRRRSHDQWCRLEPVYDAFASQRTGYLRRTPQRWERNVFHSGSELASTVITYEERDEIVGYLVYTAERSPAEISGDDGPVLVDVTEFVWRVPAAYRALWEYLRQIDLARRVTLRRVPTDDPAPHLFTEPRQLHATQRDGLMARIVDVGQALTQRRYDTAGSLTFEVLDEIAPWNAGRWELLTDGDHTRVHRTGRTPELIMPIATVAPLVFGHFTTSQAARMGRLGVYDHSALSRWDTLLRTEQPPGCADEF